MIAIINAKIVLENGILDGATLTIENGKIIAFGNDIFVPEGAQIVDAAGKYLAPGFVDIHVHGGGGAMFAEEPALAARHFLSHGETTVLPTLYYDYDKEGLIRAIGRIREAKSSGLANNISGIYMEGPYMNPRYGASPEKNKWQGEITADKYMELVDEVKDLVKVWVIAPEREGIEAFVQHVTAKTPGVVISVGHSEATPDEVFALKKYGISLMTHCMNATGRIKTEPGTRSCGPDEACLMDKDMYAELICDSEAIHVHADMQKFLMAIKGAEKIILISDSFVSSEIPPENLSHITDLSFDASGGLCGSKLTLDKALKNIIKHTCCTLVDAVRMTSTNPARAVGLYDEVGSIEVGKRANLIILNNDLSLDRVYLDGEEII